VNVPLVSWPIDTTDPGLDDGRIDVFRWGERVQPVRRDNARAGTGGQREADAGAQDAAGIIIPQQRELGDDGNVAELGAGGAADAVFVLEHGYADADRGIAAQERLLAADQFAGDADVGRVARPERMVDGGVVIDVRPDSVHRARALIVGNFEGATGE